MLFSVRYRSMSVLGCCHIRVNAINKLNPAYLIHFICDLMHHLSVSLLWLKADTCLVLSGGDVRLSAVRLVRCQRDVPAVCRHI